MAVVYLHLTEDENIPFYIGIGKDISRAYHTKQRSDYWSNIKNKHGLKVQILYSNIKWSKACKIEKELIKFYGRRDLGTGTLCNLTEGGEGVVGNVVSSKTKELLSQINTGNKHTKETKLKLSKSVEQLDKEGNFLLSYTSMKEAHEKTSVNFRGISEVCRGNRKTAGGYIWRYKT